MGLLCQSPRRSWNDTFQAREIPDTCPPAHLRRGLQRTALELRLSPLVDDDADRGKVRLRYAWLQLVPRGGRRGCRVRLYNRQFR